MSDDYILVTISACEGSSSHQQATRHIHWLAARPQCQPVRKSLGERRLEYPTLACGKFETDHLFSAVIYGKKPDRPNEPLGGDEAS